jgi:hypothetical protein
VVNKKSRIIRRLAYSNIRILFLPQQQSQEITPCCTAIMKAPTWHAAGERQKKIIMDPITDQQAKNPNAVEPEQCDATISFNGGLNCRSRC